MSAGLATVVYTTGIGQRMNFVKIGVVSGDELEIGPVFLAAKRITLTSFLRITSHSQSSEIEFAELVKSAVNSKNSALQKW